MSVADKITRLKTARDNIRTALAGYDVDASDHGYEDFADDIEGINIFDPDDYAVNIIETTGEPIEPDASEIHTFSNIQTDGTSATAYNTGLRLFDTDVFPQGFELTASFSVASADLTENSKGTFIACKDWSSSYMGFYVTHSDDDNATARIEYSDSSKRQVVPLLTDNTLTIKYDRSTITATLNGTTWQDTVSISTTFPLVFGGLCTAYNASTNTATWDRCTKVLINSVTVKPLKYQVVYSREYKYMSKAETMPQDAGYWDRQDVVEAQLPTTLKRLKDNAFCMDAGNSKLERVNLEHITHVGARAFGWCSKMRIFNFENVTSLAATFLVGYGNRSDIVYDVEEIILPKLEIIPRLIPATYKVTSTRYPHLRFIDLSGAKTLGTSRQSVISTDYNDSKINLTIKFGNDVEVIGDYAFQYTFTIDGGALNFPKLTSLGNSAFFHSGVQKVINLGTITEIKTNAFRECYGLVFVRIPSTVTTISGNAFLEYHSGMVMVVEAVTPPSTSGAPGASTIYVPDESVDAYKAATGWSSAARKIHPMSEYTGTD